VLPTRLSSDRETTVGPQLGLKTGDLASSELVHALAKQNSERTDQKEKLQSMEAHRVVGVVHIVMDGVNATAGASVTASRALISGGGLRRSVRDGVAGAGAAALESVVELQVEN
jgi:hypothetical protein